MVCQGQELCHSTAYDFSKYFWINKDQKNIKERFYDFEINSFVQKQRKVHKKKRSLKLQASIKARHFPWGFREVNSIPSRNHNATHGCTGACLCGNVASNPGQKDLSIPKNVRYGSRREDPPLRHNDHGTRFRGLGGSTK